MGGKAPSAKLPRGFCSQETTSSVCTGWNGDGTARGLSLSANLAKPEKPWHPTKIKGGIFFIICLSGFCCHGFFVVWEFPPSSFSVPSLLYFFFFPYQN